MALTQCPDCGKDVSSEAPHCPHCGRPVRPPDKPVPVVVRREAGVYEGAGAIGTVLGVVLGIAGVTTDNTALTVVGSVLFVVGLVVFIVGRFK